MECDLFMLEGSIMEMVKCYTSNSKLKWQIYEEKADYHINIYQHMESRIVQKWVVSIFLIKSLSLSTNLDEYSKIYTRSFLLLLLLLTSLNHIHYFYYILIQNQFSFFFLFFSFMKMLHLFYFKSSTYL